MNQKLSNDDCGKDLSSVVALMKNLDLYHDEIEIRRQEVEELKNQGSYYTNFNGILVSVQTYVLVSQFN